MRERDIQAAMAIPGRFKPDGCWTPVLGGKTGDSGRRLLSEHPNAPARRSCQGAEGSMILRQLRRLAAWLRDEPRDRNGGAR